MEEDYQIRAHIIEVRDLKARDSSGMSDPIVFVECTAGDKVAKKNTEIRKQTLNATFDTCFFFDLSLTEAEVRQGRITVRVFDANTFRRNVLIGAFEFDMTFVNSQPAHEVYKRWVALTDLTDKHEGIQGYLRLSMVVLGPGDEAAAHDDDDDDDEGASSTDLASMVLLPPTVSTQEVRLEARIYRAECLPKMDAVGKCDGYVKVAFAGVQERTQTIKNSYSPTWNQQINIPVITPCMSDTIELSVWDWDAPPRHHDHIATVNFSFAEIQAGGHREPTWVHLYSQKKPGKYLGRVLVGFGLTEMDGVKLCVTDIGADPEPAASQIIVRLDAYEGTELPIASDKYKLELSIAEHTARTKSEHAKKHQCHWYTSCDDIVAWVPTDPRFAPDVFVHLYHAKPIPGAPKHRLAFLQIPFADLKELAQRPTWHQLTFHPEAPAAKHSSAFPGYILVNVGTVGSKDIAKPRLTRPPTSRFQLRVHLYQARNLPAADGTGFSDPYVLVRVGPHKAKSSIKTVTLNPTWYETISIDLELPTPLVLANDVSLLVYDHDRTSKDDLLGRVSLEMSRLPKDMPDKPKWLPIYLRDQSKAHGELLVSAQLLPDGRLSPPPSIKPATKDCVVEVSVIGLRDLIPYKMLPIQSAFIDIDCGDASQKVSTTHSSKPTAANPSVMEVLSLPLRLPVDPLFAPALNVVARDHRAMGALKPVIGAASIPLGPYMPWANDAPPQLSLPVVVDEIPGAVAEPAADATRASALLPAPSDSAQGAGVHADDVVVEIHEGSERRSARRGLLANAGDTSLEPLTDPTVGERTIPDVDETQLGADGGDDDDDDDDGKGPKRDTVPHELELAMGSFAFDQFPLSLGKVRGLNKMERVRKRARTLSKAAKPKLSAAAEAARGESVTAGLLKGAVRVLEGGSAPRTNAELADLYKNTHVVVRVYVLKAEHVVPKDSNGLSDPYVAIKWGKQSVRDRDNVQKKTLNPLFYEMYELKGTLPAASQLEITLWDWDAATSDDLIGRTSIDIENRYFSSEWREMALKPIENRTLWSPTSSNAQGKLQLWVDIMTPEEAERTPPVPIARPEPESFVVRAVVWNVRNCVFKDKGMSDIFVSGILEGSGPKAQLTDVHWRSEDGNGAFNWRFVFPITLPTKVPRLKISLWDRDVLNPNDAIGEAIISLKGVFKKAYKTKEIQSIERQWVRLMHPNFEGLQGECEISLDVLTEDDAACRPAGTGRKEPNQNPHLPEPVRPDSSFGFWRVDKALAAKIKKNRFKIFGPILLLFVIVVSVAASSA